VFVAFVSFVLTDRSARRFLRLFVLSFVRLVYRLFFCVSSVLSLLDLRLFVLFSLDTSLNLSFDSSFGRSLVGRLLLQVLC
jgi:hypothetical protein